MWLRFYGWLRTDFDSTPSFWFFALISIYPDSIDHVIARFEMLHNKKSEECFFLSLEYKAKWRSYFAFLKKFDAFSYLVTGTNELDL